MFSTRQSREHSLRKRMISNVYSKSYIQSSAASKAQSHVLLFDRLLPLLAASAAEPQAPHGIDVHSTFLATTMDFITAYIFGIRNSTNFLQDSAYREHWLQLYMSRHDYPFFPQELPRLTKFLRRIGLLPYPNWVDAANREMEAWNNALCQRTLASAAAAEGYRVDPKDTPIVVDALLAGLRKEDSANGRNSILYTTAGLHRNLTIKSELFDHILAGQETAGVTLTYLTWQLSMRQDLQRQLSEELLGIEPNMQVAGENTGGNIPDPKILDALPTLHAVVMEALRLHAALPGPLPRETPFPSCYLGKYMVPGGVRVAALAHTLHRHEDIFPNPEKFDHTRWLTDNAGDESFRRRQRQFWAFSSGGRMCIGSNFAMHGGLLRLISLAMNVLLTRPERNEAHCRCNLRELQHPCRRRHGNGAD
jgi:cytochrome P450